MVSSVIRNASSDRIFRSATQYLTKFFNHGWGDIETYQKLNSLQKIVFDKQKMNEMYELLKNVDVKLSKGKRLNSSMTVYKGEFQSPLASLAPKMLPAESETAHFQLVLPDNFNAQKPMCIQLAGTGDHFFWRRRQFMAAPLAKDYNIGSIILENPFYGYRKPKNQSRSAVNHVSDIFVMGAALLVECVTLLLWCEKRQYGPLGITGISMGGHMSTIAASGWTKPLAIVPCLSWSSAGPAFTDGVLSHAVSWDVLQKQLNTNTQYKDMLRSDQQFQNMLKTHYVKNALANNNNNPSVLSEEPSVLSDMFNNVTSMFSGLQPQLQQQQANQSTLDTANKTNSNSGKKQIPSALEIDFMKYVNNVPEIFNSTTKYLNIDYLKDLVWPYEKEYKEPKEETIEFMTAIMDQATHLAHYNKPHPDSSVIYVVADHDRYIPHECYNVTPPHIYGKEQTEVRTIDTGHVLAILQHNNEFRTAIKDAFVKLGCKF